MIFCFFHCLESDFIDVPTIPKSSEPILLPDDESHDIIETSNNNTSSEFIELDNNEDESSHNSTAIEDIKMFIDDDDKNQATMSNLETNELSTSQLVSKMNKH